MLPDDMLKSDACRTLPHAAHRILVALAAQYYGKNNGSLSLTRKTSAQYGIRDPYALADGLRELEERGLILRTRPGSRIPPRSSLFAIGWRPIDEPDKLDPHNATPTLSPRDGWRIWKATTRRQGWATKRLPRQHSATRTSSTALHGEAEMSSTALHARPSDPVAQRYRSDISGMADDSRPNGSDCLARWENDGGASILDYKTAGGALASS
jgi:hypothetical protein